MRVLAAGDRAGADRGALAGGIDLALRRLENLRAGAAEDDARALVEEPLRRGLADATATAGDEDDLAFVLLASLLLSSSVHAQ